MNKTIRCLIGTIFVVCMLVLASTPVQATDRDCGDCEVDLTFLGGPNWQESQLYNSSAYTGPYVEWWDTGDNLNFTVILDITNDCGQATDFEWTIEVDAESRNWNQPGDCYAILGGDNSPVISTNGAPIEDTVWVANLADDDGDEQTVYVEVYNTYYFSYVDITVTIEPSRNGIPVGNLKIYEYEWDGFV